MIALFALLPGSLYASGKSERGRRARQTQTPPVAAQETASESLTETEAESGQPMYIGTDQGFFSIDSSGKKTALWQGGSVRKIVSAPDNVWALIGSEGIAVSNDMQQWETRNHGLPIKTIKIFNDGKKSFLPMVQEIKDLQFNPTDPQIMVCATKNTVFLSRNQGHSWTSVGAPAYRTNGIKAVASAYMPGADKSAAAELTIFISHSTYGIFYYQPDRRGAEWIELGKGLETLETTGNPDEVADIAVMCNLSPDGTASAPVLFASQTFRRRIYQLDWDHKTFRPVWSDDSPFGTVDSLHIIGSGLYFLYEGAVASLDFPDFTMRTHPDITDSVRKTTSHLKAHCAVLQNDEHIILNELWLLDEPDIKINMTGSSIAQGPGNKEGLYLPVNHAMDSHSLKPYFDVIERGGLNMIVIDMKDDYGRLRFTPHNAAISAKGRVFRPLDIDAFLHDMKSRGIYTVARIVVFKDPELAAKENGKYAVWDARTKKPWVGYNGDTMYDERWVDPYSEEVWEYTAATAAELHERGFDEIQFDYIRFPTDGDNLGDARYRWQDNGMDMESAILSFLRHIRQRVKAPISIDIYGANGWYRTGARTGQEVELLAPWVDVICPMYYPSHFEQHFLAQSPPEQRPWRIYFQGTLRTSRISRGQAIIRPYLQAFFLNVSYDRKYYNADYVRLQTEGVRAAGFGGLTYWNNSGRYDDIPDK